jgi:4-amino-4-deoxy-L-arabinose transferase-like glycosyltransferase
MTYACIWSNVRGDTPHHLILETKCICEHPCARARNFNDCNDMLMGCDPVSVLMGCVPLAYADSMRLPATPRPKYSRRWMLGAVLMLGVILRLYNLTGHGLAAYDEATYLLVADDEARRFEWVLNNVAYLCGAREEPDRVLRSGPSFYMAKPVYSQAVAILAWLAGSIEASGALISGLCGLVFPLVLYIAARQAWKGTRSAAAVLFYAALSPVLIHYAHTSMAESAYLLFYGIFLAFLIRLVESDAFNPALAALAGLAAGLAFLTHYRFATALVYAFVALGLTRQGRGVRTALWMSLGFLIVIFAFYVQDIATVWVGFAAGVPFEYPDLLDQLIMRYDWDRTTFGLRGWHINLEYWLRLEPVGLIAFLLAAVASLFKAARRWQPADRFLAWCLLFNLLHNSFADQVNFSGLRYLRSLTNLLPVYLLLFGRFHAIATSELSARTRRALAIALAGAFVVSSYPMYRQITAHQSLYREAFAHFESRYGGGYTTAPTIGMVYLGAGRTDYPFSRFTRVEGDGMLVDFPADAAKFGVEIPGLAEPRTRRAVMHVAEIWERPETCFSLPLHMESGVRLRDLEPWMRDEANRRFYFGRLRFAAPDTSIPNRPGR